MDISSMKFIVVASAVFGIIWARNTRYSVSLVDEFCYKQGYEYGTCPEKISKIFDASRPNICNGTIYTIPCVGWSIWSRSYYIENVPEPYWMPCGLLRNGKYLACNDGRCNAPLTVFRDIKPTTIHCEEIMKSNS